jgi:periplasmic copper chaperone A
MLNASCRTTHCLMIAAGYAALAWMAAPAFAEQSAPAVQAKDAWIRWLPASLPAAGYVILHNTGDKPVVLMGAVTAAYGSTMLHETRNKDAVSEMVNADKITIPARGTMTFSPGGYHIMLMQEKKLVRPGDTVPITLKFEGGDQLTVNFEVRNADGQSVGGMKGMDMNGMHNVQH